MIRLVQSYRGWTQKQVAEALERNVHALVPDSGNPKLDLVVKLSTILDWPLEMVVADLRDAELEALAARRARGASAAPEGGDRGVVGEPIDPAALVRRAWELCEAEQWSEVLRITETDAIDRLDSSLRGTLLYYRQIALESEGQYLAAADCCRAALDLVPCDSDAAARLRAALAYLHYTTGAIDEADALASALIAEIGAQQCSGATVDFALLGFAHLVRGLALRDRAQRANSLSRTALVKALSHFDEARRLFISVEGTGVSSRNSALARTAHFAGLEVGVLSGEAPDRVVDEVLAEVDRCGVVERLDSRAAESLGWCCVFASRVIVANADRIVDPERKLAILTSKADEVAERLGHWALREQLFGIEHLHRVLGATAGTDVPDWNFDDDDLRTLMGTMGRFPRFRRLGWKILNAVREERKDGGP